jgi:hypothetical protein
VDSKSFSGPNDGPSITFCGPKTTRSAPIWTRDSPSADQGASILPSLPLNYRRRPLADQRFDRDLIRRRRRAQNRQDTSLEPFPVIGLERRGRRHELFRSTRRRDKKCDGRRANGSSRKGDIGSPQGVANPDDAVPAGVYARKHFASWRRGRVTSCVGGFGCATRPADTERLILLSCVVVRVSTSFKVRAAGGQHLFESHTHRPMPLNCLVLHLPVFTRPREAAQVLALRGHIGSGMTLN